MIISVILKAAKTECCDMGSKTQFYLAPCWLAVVSSFLEAFRENAHAVLGLAALQLEDVAPFQFNFLFFWL